MTEDEMKAKIASLEAEKEGLKTKNSELIDREKAAKTAAETATREKEEAAERAKLESGTELEQAQAQIKKLERERDQAVERADKSEGALKSANLSNGIKAALTANNVNSNFASAVEALFTSKAVFDDGAPTIEDLPLADYAKKFFASKEGQFFVDAPKSSGSGSTGTEAVDSYANKPFNAEQFSIQRKTDPAGAEAWAKATGNDHLVN